MKEISETEKLIGELERERVRERKEMGKRERKKESLNRSDQILEEAALSLLRCFFGFGFPTFLFAEK